MRHERKDMNIKTEKINHIRKSREWKKDIDYHQDINIKTLSLKIKI